MTKSCVVYVNEVLNVVPRFLSLLDRKPFSPTFGSFDRDYWQYKMIDFSGASLQCACLTLALLYKNKYPGNIYYGITKIREWAFAALKYLIDIQNEDGSFNNCYPYIWSMAVVAFPMYAATETYFLLKEEMNPFDRSRLESMFLKAGKWLANTDDIEVTNQMAGGAIALYNIYLISGQEKFRKAAHDKVSKILATQTTDGNYYEYGGGDIGYTTVCIDYLAKYYKKVRDPNLLESLSKAVEFCSYFIHPNATLGGEYASRNNEFFIPSGFEILASEISLAAGIRDCLIRGLRNKMVITLSTLDAVYMCLNANTFLEAYDNYNQTVSSSELLRVNDFVPRINCLREAKIAVMQDKLFYIVLGLGKGGVIKVYLKERGNQPAKLLFSDCGFIGRLTDGTFVTSQWCDDSYETQFDDTNAVFSVSGQFHVVKQSLPSSSMFLLSRLALPIIRRSQYLRVLIYQRLRKLLITRSHKVEIYFYRRVEWVKDNLLIFDKVTCRKKVRWEYLNILDKFTSMYGQSKEFFQNQEIENMPIGINSSLAQDLTKNGEVEIRREIDLREEKIKTCVSDRSFGASNSVE